MHGGEGGREVTIRGGEWMSRVEGKKGGKVCIRWMLLLRVSRPSVGTSYDSAGVGLGSIVDPPAEPWDMPAE